MRQHQWFMIVLLGCLAAANARTITKRDAFDSLNPALQEVDPSEDNVRDKRHQDLKFGVKNAILGFVFNPSSASSATKKVVTTSTTKRPTTTQDIVIFEKDKPVSLEIPDQLFGSSFTLITNLSETVGDFVMNSAIRTQRLLESMRPFFWKVFGAKGVVIEQIDNKPLFSDGSADDNDVRR